MQFLQSIENYPTMSSDAAATFSRIRVAGKDRAKFLHNFCTNNIKALAAGAACEAFFTDVRARVLAHGYVLSFDLFHEIWMLPGDSAALSKHLNKYIITEDVAVTDLGENVQTLVYHESSDVYKTPLLQELTESSDGITCRHVGPSDGSNIETIVLRFAWANERLIAVSGMSEQISPLQTQISATPLNRDEIARLRIRERFPVIGQDMSIDHLAPEAERNSAAISYTKGCYLGQEPIARLDAMGHVNRALRVVEFAGAVPATEVVGCSILTVENSQVGSVTSAAQNDSSTIVGLSIIKVSAIAQPVFCELASGVKLSGRCLPL